MPWAGKKRTISGNTASTQSQTGALFDCSLNSGTGAQKTPCSTNPCDHFVDVNWRLDTHDLLNQISHNADRCFVKLISPRSHGGGLDIEAIEGLAVFGI